MARFICSKGRQLKGNTDKGKIKSNGVEYITMKEITIIKRYCYISNYISNRK